MEQLTLFLDRAVEVSGGRRSVGGKIVNPIAIHTFIADYIAANPSLITTPTLAQVLVAGNTTGGSSINTSNGSLIRAANGGGTLNLRDGLNSNVGLTTDSGAYNEAWIFLEPTLAQIGFDSFSYVNCTEHESFIQFSPAAESFSYMYVNKIGMAELTDETIISKSLSIYNNTGGNIDTTSTGLPVNICSGTALTPTTFNQNVTHSAALGGIGMTVKTDNSAYANQLALTEAGSTFETIVTAPNLTADRTITIPDADGQVQLINTVFVASPTVHTAENGQVVLVTTGVANLAVNLPSGAVLNQQITIVKEDAGAGQVLITPAGIETINGVAGATSLLMQWNSLTLVSNGADGWIIIASV